MRERFYTLGYIEGYLVEQVFLGGAVVGATFKIGKILVRGGISLAKGLVLPLKTAFQAAARMKMAKSVMSKELFHALDRAMARAAGTPLVKGQVPKTVLDAIEEALERLGPKRANFGTRQYVEAQILNRPNIQALILQEGAETAFTHNLGLFCNFMGDQIDDKLMANFVKAFDEKLIVTAPNGALRDFAMEFMLSFKGQSSLLGAAITDSKLKALASATDIDKAAMKAAFQDGGSVWSIDNVVTPEMPVAAVRRGVVCETAYYYHHRWADGWLRDASVTGIDWWKGSVVEQFKTKVSPTLGEMKKYLEAMLVPGRAVGGKTFILDVRVPPASTLDRNAFKATVDQYIASQEFQNLVEEGEQVIFKIDVYDFRPN